MNIIKTELQKFIITFVILALFFGSIFGSLIGFGVGSLDNTQEFTEQVEQKNSKEIEFCRDYSLKDVMLLKVINQEKFFVIDCRRSK